jgi:pimeloyl-ACP methyl ester carboxylesterase
VRAPGYEIGPDRSDYDEFCAVWGTLETPIEAVFAPSQLGDEGLLRWAQRFERQSSTPQNMLAIMALDADMDVREVLPAIRVPTLVVDARQDLTVDIEHVRYLAANIPGATLFEYDGEHLSVLVGVDETLDVTEDLAPLRPEGLTPAAQSAAESSLRGPRAITAAIVLRRSHWGS